MAQARKEAKSIMTKPAFLSRAFPILHEQQDTIIFIQRMKREAVASKRACAQASNPFRAVPGLEKEFDEAANTIRYCDRLLTEVDKKPERERIARNLTRLSWDILDRFAAIVLIIGLLGVWYIGFTYLSITLHVHPIFLNLGAVAAAVCMVLWARKKRRK